MENARISCVRSSPVDGCTSPISPGRATILIGSRGTPKPISSSGQIGMKSTCASSSSRRLVRTTWPL